ncbi:MAG TPA: hypothetical protein VF339_07500 [Gammaproteobacteria bacterium]
MYQCFFAAPPDSQASSLMGEPSGVGAAARAGAHGAGAAGGLPSIPASGDAGDFDFLHGEWLVENRRLADPEGAASEWTTFDAVHTCRPLAGGAGHLEEIASEDGVAGAVLRLFDARSRRWAIHRISPGVGTPQPALHGGFDGVVGVFVGEETWHGRPVLVRETWSGPRRRPHWEQAVSTDGGRSWLTCWVRDFIRVDWPQ